MATGGAADEFVIAEATGAPIPVVTRAAPVLPKPPAAPGRDVPWDAPARKAFHAAKAALADAAAAAREVAQADELARYLGRICGREPERIRSADEAPEAAIVIGEACPPEVRAAAGPLGKDGFLIRSVGRRLFVCGGGRHGTLHGIYALLEDLIGCRWWAHDAEFVPSMPRIAIPAADLAVEPPFLLHDLLSQEAQTPRNNMVWKTRSRSTFQPTGNHTLHRLLADDAARKPEYWPFVGSGTSGPGIVAGRAVAANVGDFNSRVLHFNYLAPGMAEDLAEALEKDLVARNGNVEDFVYMAGQGDWYGGLDQSPESLAVYDAETWTDADGAAHRGHSAPLVRLMNRTGEILAARHPGMQVGTMAYMSTDSPPGMTKPGDNVWIWVPRLRYGITLSIEEAAAAGDATTTPDAVRRSRAIRRSLERWGEIAPGRLLIWEYGVNFANFLVPTPNLRAMAANIGFYHRLGARGLMIQGNYTSTGSDLVLLKNYVWRRLLWRPDLDPEPLIREFCAGYYGPASTDILAYVDALETSVRTPHPVLADEFDTAGRFLTSQVVEDMTAALDRARARVAGPEHEVFRERVEEVAASLEARALWKDGPLVEREGRLVRADIAAPEGTDTAARAAALLRSIRGAAATESSCAALQHRRMLSWHGGPLQLLRGGDTTAAIAPVQGTRRLWRLSVDGRTAVEKSSVTPGSDLFDVVGSPDADRIRLTGATGFGAWDTNPDHHQRETIAVDARGVLHWTASLDRTNPREGATAAPRIESHYAVADPRSIRVEYDAGAGWTPIEAGVFTGKGRPRRAEELRGAAPEPFIVELPPATPFRLRVIRDDTGCEILDTLVSPRAVAACAVWVPAERVVKTYVWCEPVSGFEVGHERPLFERTIAPRPR